MGKRFVVRSPSWCKRYIAIPNLSSSTRQSLFLAYENVNHTIWVFLPVVGCLVFIQALQGYKVSAFFNRDSKTTWIMPGQQRKRRMAARVHGFLQQALLFESFHQLKLSLWPHLPVKQARKVPLALSPGEWVLSFCEQGVQDTAWKV